MAITFNHNDQVYVKDGKMGIGASDPLRNLHVVGSFAVNAGTDEYYGVLIQGGESATPKITIGDWHNSSATIKWDSSANHLVIDSQNSSSGSAILFTGNDSATEYMRITSSGNVGIGTTSPGAKLDVRDGALFVGNYSGVVTPTDGIWLERPAGNSTKIQMYTLGSSVFNITSDGTTANIGWGSGADREVNFQNTGAGTIKVGIGTGSPGDILHVSKTGAATRLRVGNNAAHDAFIYFNTSTDWSIGTDTSNSNSLTFGNSSGLGTNTKMVIETSGNVGIGTTSPDSKFHVLADNSTIATFESIGSNANSKTLIVQSGGDRIIFDAKEASGGAATDLAFELGNSEVMRLADNGNVGIGTASPADKLTVNGDLSVFTNKIYNGAASNSAGLDFVGSKANIHGYHGITFNSSNAGIGSQAERMRITSGGNVGIGTTAPLRKLDVAGITRTSGFSNTNNHIEKLLPAVTFPHNVANQNVDIQLGNISFWGYIEVEITSTFSQQSSSGKLTKIYTVGTNPAVGSNAGIIYVNESRVSDSIGTIKDNIALGDFSFDGTDDTGTFVIRVSHIVSTGNSYTIKVRAFTHGSNGSQGAAGILTNLSTSAVYTETALGRQYVYYNDNVGIGTDSPQRKLHIKGDSWAEMRLEGQTFASGHGASLEFYSEGTALADVYASTDKHLYFRTNGTAERMRITSAGNVGIGVTAPATDLSLGDGTHTSPGDTDRILNWYSATGGTEISNSSHYITVGQSSSNTTQPKSVGLALFNQNTTNNTYSPAITFGGLSTSGNYMNGAAAIAAQLISNTNDNNFRSGELTFYTQGSTSATRGLVERMRIDGSGNVGIGTTSPVTGLDVRTSAYSNTTARFGTTKPVYIINDEPIIGLNMYYHGGWKAGSSGYSGYLGMKPSNGDMYFRLSTQSNAADAAVTDTTPLYIKNNGNVGIGTTSSARKLDIRGGVSGNVNSRVLRLAESSNSERYDFSLETSGSLRLNEGVSDSALMTWKNNGNVGIGTTTISGQQGTANGTPKLQVLKTGTTGSYDLVARFGTDQDESNSGASVLINAGNDRGLLVSAGRADSNRAVAHLNLIQYDGNELTDGLTIYQPNTGSSGATSGTNVGIGTTSPSAKLHVAGNVLIGTNGFDEADTPPADFADLHIHTLTDGTPIAQDDAASLVISTGANNTGVQGWNGTLWFGNSDYPAAGNANNSSGTQFNWKLAGIGSYASTDTGNSNTGSGDLRFFTTSSAASPTERMIITNGGNVGIGTTSPTLGLHVANGLGALFGPSGSGASTYISADDENTINGGYGLDTDTADLWVNYRGYQNGTSRFRDFRVGNGKTGVVAFFDGSSGNVGIGTTSPGAKLDVAGSIGVTSGDTFGYDNYNGSIYMASSGRGLLGKFGGSGYARNLIKSDGSATLHIGDNTSLISRILLDAGSSGTNGYISLQTKQTERVRINSNGNVGIGTTSPGQRLHINDGGIRVEKFATGLGGFISVGNGTEIAGNYSAYFFGNTASDDGYFKGGIAYETLASTYGRGDMHFLQNSSTGTGKADISDSVMTILNSGNVGIGTTSPTSLLEISQQLSAVSTIDYPYTISSRDDGNTLNQLGGEGVGIKFRIAGNASATPGDSLVGASIAAIRESSGDSDSSTGLGFFITQNDETLDEAVRIDHDGNVGIGTSSPTQKLDVNGDIAVKGASVINKASAALTIGDTAGTDSVTNLTLTTAGGNTEVFLDDSGNVGINTATPSYNLTVNSGTNDIGILTASSDSGSYVGFLDNSTSTIPKIGAVGNKLVLDASQYVGVRRTDPSYALDVNGTIRATGNVIAYSDARVKENVETIPNALDKVKSMRGVGYNKIGEEKRSIGVIAQELLEVVPEAVHQDEKGMYSVAYGNLVGVLVEAMKEQQQQIDELKALIASK